MYYANVIKRQIMLPIKFLLIIIILFITTNCFSDEFRIGFSVYPKELQKQFAEQGRKLDLSGNDRTKDSFGFIENKGTSIVIYTYRSATEEDMKLILKIIQGN